MPVSPKILIIACGALARELVALRRANGWNDVRIRCLPADLHNTPERIPGAVRKLLEEHLPAVDAAFVAYGDCGTGGRLDAVLRDFGVARLPGAHCYEFLAGRASFERLAMEEPGTFFLTDFLVTHFDRLVRKGLGLDRHPHLRDAYFGNYRRVMLLSQTKSPDLIDRARAQARFLRLEFAHHHTGLDPLAARLEVGTRCPG